MAWLTGIGAKIVAALALIAGLFGAKAIYDRNRRREGVRDVTDQLGEQGAKREDAMKQAPKPETDKDVLDTLDEGRG